MKNILQVIVEKLISKKKVVGWVAAALIPVIGVAISMDAAEVKAAICEAK